MSATVCGKRAFFEEMPSPPVSKRIRCSSSSPIQISPSRSGSGLIAQSLPSPSSSTLLNHIISLFPDMDKKLIQRTLEDCGNDLESAIRSLNELHLPYAENHSCLPAGQSEIPPLTNQLEDNVKNVSSEDTSAPASLSMNGSKWVELFVKEMMSANNLEDARLRASRALEAFEKSICAGSESEPVHLGQENSMLKEQIQVIVNENTILKRAVAIQHERQKEFDDKAQELQHLKQLVFQYQEQLRSLEVNNYALQVHLKQAQQSCSIPGRFHPDVF